MESGKYIKYTGEKYTDFLKKSKPSLLKSLEELEKGLKGDWEKEGYSVIHDYNKDRDSHEVNAYDKDGNKVGGLHFYEHESGNLKVRPGSTVWVNDKDRRKGVASAMYSLGELKTGKKFMRGNTTPAGSKIWDNPNRKFGKPEELEKAVPYPARVGQLYEDDKVNYQAVWHKPHRDNKDVAVWAHHPDLAKKNDDFIDQNKDKYIASLKPEHQEIARNFINHIQNSPSRHIIVGTDRGVATPRIRHIKQLFTGNENAQLHISSPDELSFTLHERHGHSTGKSVWSFNKKENKPKVILHKSDKDIGGNHEMSKTSRNSTGTNNQGRAKTNGVNAGYESSGDDKGAVRSLFKTLQAVRDDLRSTGGGYALGPSSHRKLEKDAKALTYPVTPSPSEDNSILSEQKNSIEGWNGAPEHLGIINGLNIKKETQPVASDTITGQYGEGIKFIGGSDGKTKAIIKGPVSHPIWKDLHPDQCSHFLDNNFNSAHREPAFFEMSKLFGLDHYIPETTLFKNPDTKSAWSAMKYIPGLDTMKEGEDHKLAPFKKTGDLHKIAIMDMILGNNDRHRGNFQFDSNGNMHLIDHASSFDYSHSTTNLYPKYTESFRHDQVGEDIHNWLNSLDVNTMANRLHSLGAPEPIVMTMAARLAQTRRWSNMAKKDPKKLNTLDTLFGLQSARRLPDHEPLRIRMENMVITDKSKYGKIDSKNTILRAIQSVSNQINKKRRASDKKQISKRKGTDLEADVPTAVIKPKSKI